MIKKRLLGIVPKSKKYIAMNVMFQWFGMCANVVMVVMIAQILNALINNKEVNLFSDLLIIVATAIARIVCVKLASIASYRASKDVKRTVRGLMYEKILRLGASYTEKVSTAEVVQLAGEGVEQLETYFGQYMPQFFYAFLAPITLFFVIRPISVKVATVLLVCVPLIPVAIVIVQKIAKKLLKNYWGQYAKLGDHFLENLQGLTTLKIYQADEARHAEMNQDAEHFRKITMKVLTMQLNSIIVMDVVAYGGAALGIMLAALGFVRGNIDFYGCFVIILLSADFFLPIPVTFDVALPETTSTYRINMLRGFVFRSWMDYLTFGEKGTGGWISPDGTINCVEKAYDVNSEKFKVSFLKHEAQHAEDYRRWNNIEPWELEYRAKLVELIYTQEMNLLEKFCREAISERTGDSHALASARIKREMGELISADIERIQTRAKELFVACRQEMENIYS